jgi:hypothetical protein
MRLVFTIPLSLLLFSSMASACLCSSSGGCPGLGGKARPVFLGTVLSVTDVPATGDPAFPGRRAHIRVDEPFGGLGPDVRETDIYTGLGNGDCGIPFEAGEVYLIDASVGKDGTLSAWICSSTRRMDEDEAEVLPWILRQRRDGKPVPSLVGQAARADRSFDGPFETLAPEPLANLLVRVKTGGKVYQTKADANGLYAFYKVPSGKYELAPDLPSGTTLAWYGSDSPPSFELHAGACQMLDIEVLSSGSIQGQILDASGTPLKSAFAYIVPAGELALPKQSQLYWEYQGKEDFFKFVHIPPGEYLIVVNPDDSLDPTFPYRRTFFPGVRERASAAAITVHGGEQIKGADIRLEQQFAPRHLTVRVTWADGRLIRDLVFVTARGTANPDAKADVRQPELKASIIELSVLPNEPYEVAAELTCRYAGGLILSAPGSKLKSNKIYLAPGDDQKELLLTIPATSCPELPGKTLLTDR